MDNKPEESNALLPQTNEHINKLKGQTDAIVEKVFDASPAETDDLLAEFNALITKKNIVRTAKMEDLLDSVTDQMKTRLENIPDQFSNQDLIMYKSSIEQSLDRAQKVIDAKTGPISPSIVFNQQNNQINLSDDKKQTLDHDSKLNVINAVKAFLSNAKINAEKTEVEPEDKEK